MWIFVVVSMLFLAVAYLIVKPYLLDWFHRRIHGHGLMMFKRPPAKHDWSKKP
jgi:hypothetical protein